MRRRKPNPERRQARHAAAYGEHAVFVRTLPCAVCLRRPVDAAHVRSRGAGGTAADLVPLCREHHAEQHTVGIATFQRRHGLDLPALARTLWDAADYAKAQRILEGVL
jgi:hypothetical protein